MRYLAAVAATFAALASTARADVFVYNRSTGQVIVQVPDSAAANARADVFMYSRSTGQVVQMPESATPAAKNAHTGGPCDCAKCDCAKCECLDRQALDSAENDASPRDPDDTFTAPPAAAPRAQTKGRVRYDVCNGRSCTTYEVNEGDPIPAEARNVRLIPAASTSTSKASPAAAADVSACESCSADEGEGQRRGIIGRIFTNCRARREARQAARAERGGIFPIFGRLRGGSCASCGQ